MGSLCLKSLLVVMSLLALDGRAAFVLPPSFLGLWQGQPSYSVLGPWANNMTFAIAQDPTSGDYLMQDLLTWDGDGTGQGIGWQRFYISSTSGLLGYCGFLHNYTEFDELAGANRLDVFQAQDPTTWEDEERTSVTYCLNSSSPDGATLQGAVLPPSCTDCDCANWTFSFVDDDRLHVLLQMAGGEGHTHSKHLDVNFMRVGAAPTIDQSMPNMSAFACDFAGRDNVPPDLPTDTTAIPASRQPLPADHPPVPPGAGASGCPFSRQRQAVDVIAARGPTSGYDHCYVLSSEAGVQLEWSLADDQSQLHVAISFPTNDTHAYVSLGFRPYARNALPDTPVGEALTELGFGKQNNFGMRSADIVLGHVNGVDTFYANLYTGPPDPDDSLTVTNSSTTLEDGRLTLRFSRPTSKTGKLYQTTQALDGSILGQDADVIWATGTVSADGEATPGYHGNQRGLRFIGWADPDAQGMGPWACA